MRALVCSLTERSADALVPLIARGDITNLNLNGNDLGDDGILKVCPTWQS